MSSKPDDSNNTWPVKNFRVVTPTTVTFGTRERLMWTVWLTQALPDDSALPDVFYGEVVKLERSGRRTMETRLKHVRFTEHGTSVTFRLEPFELDDTS